MNEQQVPKLGEIVTADIFTIGKKGDGIAKVDGFVVIVKDGKVANRVKIKITKVMKRFAFGELAKQEA